MAFIVSSNVSNGQVLTDTKWNQDVVENTTQLYNTTRLYQSSARTSSLTITATPQNVFATGATFPAVSGLLYHFQANFPYVYVNGTDNAQFSLVLTGAVSVTYALAYALGNTTGGDSVLSVYGNQWWVATATGNVTANVTAQRGTSGIGRLDAETGHDIRLRVTGPMLTV